MNNLIKPIKSIKIHQFKNRLRRLANRERDAKNPLNPRQILRLNELRGLGVK